MPTVWIWAHPQAGRQGAGISCGGRWRHSRLSWSQHAALTGLHRRCCLFLGATAGAPYSGLGIIVWACDCHSLKCIHSVGEQRSRSFGPLSRTGSLFAQV